VRLRELQRAYEYTAAARLRFAESEQRLAHGEVEER
jgi:hypothetical protein